MCWTKLADARLGILRSCIEWLGLILQINIAHWVMLGHVVT